MSLRRQDHAKTKNQSPTTEKLCPEWTESFRATEGHQTKQMHHENTDTGP